MAVVAGINSRGLVYCVMYADRNNNVHCEYMHAENTTHAKAQFWAGKPRGRGTIVIAAGPAIGFFEDKDGIHAEAPQGSQSNGK